MKKSLIALLLVVALVVTVSVFAVSAETTNPFEGATETVTADCPYCGADQTWYPILSAEAANQMQNWTGATEKGGHFYCTDNWTDGKGDTFTTGTWCINLNGKVITRTDSNWFTMSGADAATAPVLNIMDTSAEQTGEMDSGAKSGNQFFAATGTGTVNVYSGIISAYGSKIAAGSSSNPTLLKADTTSAATFNFYGGTLKGYSQYTAGLMRIEGSTTVNIDGATLDGKGGTNTIKVNGANAKLYLNSGSLTGASMSAGKDGCAVVLEGGAYFEMNGGTLTGTNTSTSAFGGAIRVTNGQAVLKGGTITGTAVEGGAIYATGSNAKVTLEGATIENSVATTTTANQHGGGAAFVAGKATFTMKSGTIKNCSTTIGGGAVNASGGTFDMQGGTIEECSGGQGGALFASSANGKVLISGDALIQNCSATTGGAIWVQYQSTGSKISGGTIKKCSSTQGGGAVYINGSGSPTLTMTGGTIENCSAGTVGGSVCVGSATGVFNMQGGTITGGSVRDNDGGNIYSATSGAQINISGGTITKGTALRVPTADGGKNTKGNGGNIYLEKATLNISGGTISGGLDSANAQHAGNIYTTANTVNITGGTITGGRCLSYGGNIYAYDCKLNIAADEGKTVAITNGKAGAGGNLYIRETAAGTDTASTTITGPNVTISGGTASGDNGTGADGKKGQCGSQIMLFGVAANPCVLTISDVSIDSSEAHTDEIALYENAELKVGGAKNIDCAYMTDNTSKVTILEGFSGDIHVRWFDATQYGTVVAGGEVDASLQHETAYTGTGVVKACDSSRSGKICALSTTSETGFAIAAFGGFNFDEEGKAVETPLTTMPTDATAYAYVRPYFSDDITLGCNTVLDINNGVYNVNTNGFKLGLIEHRSDEFSDEKSAGSGDMTGYVTVDDATKLQMVTKVNGNNNQYITLPFGTTEAGAAKYTARRVAVNVDSVSIRPATADLYYTTSMDTSLLATDYVKSYGVVLSLDDMPDAAFVSDAMNLYTETDYVKVEGERLTIAGENSALLTGILNKNAPEGQNNTWGTMPIYANAYVCFHIDSKDYYVMADETVQYSLKDIMEIVDGNAELAANASVIKMYNNWQDPLAAWGLDNIAANAVPAA